MNVSRIVPDINSKPIEACREFYSGILGLQVAVDMGYVVTLAGDDHFRVTANLC